MNKIEERIFKLYEKYKPYYEKVHIITRNKDTQRNLQKIFKNNGMPPMNRVYKASSEGTGLTLEDSMIGQDIKMIIFEDGFLLKEIEQLLTISYIGHGEEVNAIVVKENINLHWKLDKKGNHLIIEEIKEYNK